MISSVWGIKKHAVFVAFNNFSGHCCNVVFAFLVNVIFYFLNEIQTDGAKRSYRRR